VFGVSALPSVILNEKLSLAGRCQRIATALIDWILAGEAGGVMSLSGCGAAVGQSPVAPAGARGAAPV
jgi:hypothetical protein